MLRRRFLQTSTLATAAGLMPGYLIAGDSPRQTLAAAPASINLVGREWGDTDVWAYNGRVPGPVLRARQGDNLSVRLDNRLPQATTVHWHGIRLPQNMDGVPHLSQPPVAPGDSFDYRFALPDAGTFWYHPHASSSEQLGRGLVGALIVEEREPLRVDRELLWVLDDWRLGRDAGVVDDFGNRHDASHAGRIGNTVTINGGIPEPLLLRSGERLRLRLVNAANARAYALDFGALGIRVIATDGHPVPPHAPAGDRVVLGPGMRSDLLIDVGLTPGESLDIVDDFYPGRAYRLTSVAVTGEPLRDQAPDWVAALPDNPVSKPDLADPLRQDLRLSGGAMGAMGGAELHGQALGPRELARRGLFWALNGVVATSHDGEPLLAVSLGRTVVMTLHNDTAWHHPMHLHGHVFQVLERDGTTPAAVEWRDTVLMAPRERLRIAFVADNPGDWMLHCHVLAHQESGMMGILRVT